MPTFLPTSVVGRTGTIQTYTIPDTGEYLLTALGAQGGGDFGGRGARTIGTFSLTAGDVLLIVVGQRPEGISGGGGATGIFLEDPSNPGSLADATPLMIAAGGGGANINSHSPNSDGRATNTLETSAASGEQVGGAGGVSGDGGAASSLDDSAGAGGGLLTDGGNANSGGSPVTDSGGKAFINGADGGAPVNGTHYGGFGGGGGGTNGGRCGGGGGYNGGGGAGSPGRGGGGGSYNAGTDINNASGVNLGAGLANIDFFLRPDPPQIESITVNDLSVEICWAAPGGDQPWADEDDVVTTITRTDCNGESHIASYQGQMSGCHVDRFAPFSRMGEFCDESDHVCEVFYTLRYFGWIDRVVSVSADPIPEGVIVAWPSTAASIPSDWSRVTAFDGRYPIGHNGSGAAGTTGGAATHTHTTPPHTHSLASHTHPGGTTGTASGFETHQVNESWTERFASTTHSHTKPTTSPGGGGTSGSASPSTSAASNDVSHKSVIFIESDGNAAGVPDGALVLFNSTTIPAGWSEENTGESHGDNTAFLKGAPAGGDGSTAKTLVTSHTHTVNSHTHTGITHEHKPDLLSGNSGDSVQAYFAGAGTNRYRSIGDHAHYIVTQSASSGNFNSAGGGTTSSASLSLPSRRLKFIKNTSGTDLQTPGIIGMWQGTVASIPSGWVLADGSNGTPDMVGRMPRHALAGVGGTEGTAGVFPSHSHATVSAHSHTTSGHTHTQTVTPWESVVYQNGPSTTATRVQRQHTHTGGSSGSSSPSSTSTSIAGTGASTAQPPTITTHFIQLQNTEFSELEETFLTFSENNTTTAVTIEHPSPGNWYVKHPVIDLEMVWCPYNVSWERQRPFSAAQNVGGGSPVVVSGIPGGRNYSMTIPAKGLNEIDDIETILSAPLFWGAPPDGPAGWWSPESISVSETRVKRYREVSVKLIEIEGPPAPGPEDFVI